MNSIVYTLESLFYSFSNFLPSLLGSLILLLIGWVLGTLVGRVVKEIILRLKVDELIFKDRKSMIKISSVVSVLCSWIIYLVFIQAAVDVLGISVLKDVIGQLLIFIPGLLKALFVSVAGYAIAEYVRGIVEKYKSPYSKLMAKVLFFLILYITVATALPLIGIDTTLISIILIILVASFGLGLAIAIGLGLKDTVAKMAKKWFK